MPAEEIYSVFVFNKKSEIKFTAFAIITIFHLYNFCSILLHFCLIIKQIEIIVKRKVF